MPDIRIELFGGFHLCARPAAPAVPTARKTCALRAYLALARGRPQARDKLAALLWPDSAEEQARASLRQALSSLRRLGGEGLVVADNATVALAHRGVTVDVAEFEALLAQGSPAALEQAAKLYRGDLLDGFHVDAPLFDQWLANERERLRGLAVGGLARLVELHAQGGAIDTAIAAASRLLAIDPLREDAHRSLMQLYWKQGRQAAALQQYRLCRAVLERELGVPPEAQTEALHRAIVQQRRIAAARVGASGGNEVPPMPARQPGAGTLENGSVSAESPAPAPDTVADEEGELSHAAILVADLAGSGASAGAGDLERSHAFLARYRATLEEIVHRHRGAMGSWMGSRAMAMFGGAAVQGNDARCAVAAGLALRDAVASLAADVHGEAVEVACRIAGQAAAGEVWITNRVYQALAGRLQAEALPAASLDVAGKPVKLWRADRLFHRGEGAALQAFVGRRAELAQLLAIAEATASGAGQAVLLRGDPGIGKSRLVDELEKRVARLGYVCHKVLVLDFGAGAQGDPLRALAASQLALESAAGEGERTRETIAGKLGDEELLVFANDLFDLEQPLALRGIFEAMDAAAREQGVRRFLARLVERTSASAPQLLVIEDVHWADARTLERLAHLAATVRSCAVLLVMTTRGDNDPIDAGWRAASRGCRLTSIDLGPLSDDEARSLAASYEAIDAAFAAACVARAAGNPLFLDQLLRAADAHPAHLPGAVQSIILARLERLAPCDRHALRAAAVLGRRFSLAALRHLIGDADYACEDPVRQALVVPEGEDYLFAHALIQEAAYVSQLPSRRRELHRRAAEWFAGRDPVLQAEHLDAAGDPAAAPAYLAAAREQAARFHNEQALALAERGAALAVPRALQWELAALRSGSPRHEARAEGGLGDACYQRGQMDSARRHFARCVELARAHGLRRVELAVLPMLGVADLYCNEPQTALQRCSEALEMAARVGDRRAELLARVVIASVRLQLGAWDETRIEAGRAIDLARQLGARRFEAEMMGVYAMTMQGAEEAAARRAMLEEAYRLGGESGRRYLGPILLGQMAQTAAAAAERRVALAEGERLLAEGCVSHCYIHFYQSAIDTALELGDPAEALRYAQALEDYVREEPCRWAVFLVRRGRALARWARGERGAALRGELLAVREEAAAAGFAPAVPAIDAALAEEGGQPPM